MYDWIVGFNCEKTSRNTRRVKQDRLALVHYQGEMNRVTNRFDAACRGL